jgi:hypothetical protein
MTRMSKDLCQTLEHPVRELNFVRRVERHDLRIGPSQSFAFGGTTRGWCCGGMGDV